MSCKRYLVKFFTAVFFLFLPVLSFADSAGTTSASEKDAWRQGTGKIWPRVISNNVGIGTSSPSANLDVNGTTNFGGNVTGTGGAITFDTNIYPAGAQYIGASDVTNRWDGIFANTINALTNIFSIGAVGIGTSTATAKLDIIAAASNTNINLRIRDSAGTDYITFLDNGNVGLGNTAPMAKLDILSGATAATETIIFRVKNAAKKDILAVGDFGNVGIGSTAAEAKLYVSDTNTTTAADYAATKYLLYVAPTSGTTRRNWALQAYVSYTALGTTNPYTSREMVGFFGISQNNSTNSVAMAYGVSGSVYNLKEGVITTGAALAAIAPSLTAGTVNSLSGILIKDQGTPQVIRAYGIKIEDQNGATTNNFGIVSEGGTNGLIGNLGVGNSEPGQKLDVTGHIGIGTTGGLYMVKMINDTGGTSRQGIIGIASTSVQAGISIAPASSADPIGVIYEDGIAQGASVWVAIRGMPQVLTKNGTLASVGYWCKTSDVAGRADCTTATSPGSVAAHFQEIGHCGQTIGAGATGTDVKVIINWHVL